jgi:TatD DNase family protein
MLIDTHCHLDYFTHDADAVVQRAAAAGVGTLVTIGTRVPQAAAAKALAERFENVWATVGVHPHNAGEADGLPTTEVVVALAQHPKVVGIGESGLDYFYNKSPQVAQQEGFRRHIRAAQATSLPLVVHARQADADIGEILQSERAAGGDFTFVLHCFSSGRELAELAVSMGGYVSLSGILTFPKSDDLRAIAADLPADRLLVETDAPYLAPAPHRGKRCEPAMVAHTAEMLARVRGWSVAETHRITTANALRLFARLRLPDAAAA